MNIDLQIWFAEDQITPEAFMPHMEYGLKEIRLSGDAYRAIVDVSATGLKIKRPAFEKILVLDQRAANIVQGRIGTLFGIPVTTDAYDLHMGRMNMPGYCAMLWLEKSIF